MHSPTTSHDWVWTGEGAEKSHKEIARAGKLCWKIGEAKVVFFGIEKAVESLRILNDIWTYK